MSKIEDYQAAKRIAERVRRNATRATGQDSPQNDKHRIACRYSGMTTGKSAVLHFEALHGYYGDSSCS